MARNKLTTAAATVVLAVVAFGSHVEAAPGDLDPTWATAGVAGPYSGQPEAIVEQDGKVLVASASTEGLDDGTIHLARLLSDGTPDPSFSGDGLMTLDPPGSVRTMALAVQPGGNTIVAAAVSSGSSVGYAIYRLTPDGTPDTNFSGDGLVTIDGDGGFSQVTGVGFRNDGNIVVGTADTFIVGGFAQLPQIRRLTDDGTVAQTVDVLGDYTERGALAQLAVSPTGYTYVLVPDDGDLTVRRYDAALSLDPTYSGDGIVTVSRPGGSADNENWGGALSVADDGSALVAGTVGTYTAGGANPPTEVEAATLVARLTPSGALDTSFSGDGIATLARPSGSITVHAVGPTANGGAAVLAERFEQPSTSSGVAWEVAADGSPVADFSGDGRLERAAYPLEGTTAAGGTRLLAVEVSADFLTSTVAAISLTPPPAPTIPGAPAAPTILSAGAGSVGLTWSSPASSGNSPVTDYVLSVYAGSSTTPERTIDVDAPAPTGSFGETVQGLDAGTAYRFTVAAVNAVGQGPESPSSAVATPPFTSIDGFVTQQFLDFTGKAPTTAQRNDLRSRILAGTTTPAEAVAEVSGRPEWATLDPLTRIYYAYFTRIPDSGGLRYWLGRRRAGVTVNRISSQFEDSSEFTNRYGSLSNRAFVELIYQNVLDRTGDPGGISYWTSQLDRRVKDRGRVMMQFSESSEHIRRRAGEVNTVSVIFGMRLRAPYASEVATWAPQLLDGKLPLIVEQLGSQAYDDRTS